MPKAKPTSVIVHRIELQQSERDMLEGYLLGSTLTKGLSVIGTILVPFGQVLGVLAGVYVLDKTAEAIISEADDILHKVFDPAGQEVADMMMHNLQLVSSYLLLRGDEGQSKKHDWSGLDVATYPDYHFQFYAAEIEPPIRDEFIIFCNSSYVQSGPWKNGRDLVKAWMAFMPMSKVLELAKDYFVSKTPSPGLFGWLLDTVT